MKKIMILLISLQLIVILLIAIKINKNYKNRLTKKSIYPINKDDLLFKSGDKLKYFYEPRSNSSDMPVDWSPYKKKYTINEDALNEKLSYSINKPKNTFRIIALGDSFTYGLFVETQDNWTEKLEEKFRDHPVCNKNIEVINLGVYGYDIEYSVQRYNIRGQKYNPDLILWFIIDPKRINELSFPLVTKYQTQDNKNSYEPWDKARDYIFNSQTVYQAYKYQLDTLNKLNQYYKGRLILMMENYSKDWPINQKNIFKDFASERNNTLIFDSITDTISNNKYHFDTDLHPNEDGHQKIAEDVFNFLTKNNIIPCK